MTVDFTPTIPPGWSVGYANNRVTLIQLPTGGDWLPVMRVDGFEPNDAQLAMIIACGIAPPEPWNNWNADLVSETFLSLPIQQRALVAPRPTEEGARKIRMEAALVSARVVRSHFTVMEGHLRAMGQGAFIGQPGEFNSALFAAGEHLHDVIQTLTGRNEDHTVWGQSKHAELVERTEVEVA